MKPRFRGPPGSHPATGACYGASEALHQLLGGYPSGWYGMRAVTADGIPHRWLEKAGARAGRPLRLDPTAEQFPLAVRRELYARGKRAGFNTRLSLGARALLEASGAVASGARRTK